MSDAATTFDEARWWATLKEHNPWAFAERVTLPRPEDWSNEHGHATDEAFRTARKAACLERYQQGVQDWNAWADGMLALKAGLEAAGLWDVRRRAVPIDEARFPPLTAQNAESVALIGAMLSDFREAQFSKDAKFAGAKFARARFPSDADFSAATFSGSADFSAATFSGKAYFCNATFSRSADFSAATFSGSADFVEATFTGAAVFQEAAFSDRVVFGAATFSGVAVFQEAAFSDQAVFVRTRFLDRAVFGAAAFSDRASFHEATFSGEAVFVDPRFDGHADFSKSTFENSTNFRVKSFGKRTDFTDTNFKADVEFSQIEFTGYTTFHKTQFKGSAKFVAVSSADGAAVSFADAQFDHVPDFEQANFKQAPRLDNVRVAEVKRPRIFAKWTRAPKYYLKKLICRSTEEAAPPFWRTPGAFFWSLLPRKSHPDLAARFRSLKRLAIQAHDSERELDFNARELKAQRWSHCFPTPGFWGIIDPRKPGGEPKSRWQRNVVPRFFTSAPAILHCIGRASSINALQISAARCSCRSSGSASS